MPSLSQSILIALDNKELSAKQICQAINKTNIAIYPVLHRLELLGFISSRWGDKLYQERGGLRRCYYSLTTDGLKQLATIKSNQRLQ